jgi:hypothetical protein
LLTKSIVFWINFTFYLLVKKVNNDLVGFFCFADKFALTTCKAKAMSSGVDIVFKGHKVSLVILIRLYEIGPFENVSLKVF